MRTPNRTIALATACIAATFYWWMFLNQPLVGTNKDFTRAYFLLTTLVYPDGIISTWTDRARLPLGFFDRGPIILATLAWLGLATAIGWPWTGSRVRSGNRSDNKSVRPINWSDRVVQAAYACLVGAALLSTLTLVVGLAGGLRWAWPLLFSAVIVCLVSWWLSKRVAVAIQTEPTAKASPPGPQVGVEVGHGSHQMLDRALWLFTIGLTIWLGTVIMLGAWLPPSEFDVVEYHLQAPKEFLQSGAIRFVPHNIYANMPLGSEMHALAAMTVTQQADCWLGGLIGKSITAALSILGAVLLGGWISQRYGARHGWVAAGLWLGTPGIANVATQGLIDGVLATYVLATAFATWQWLRPVDPANMRAIQIQSVMLGILAGACAAIKYPGLIFGTLPCLAVCGTALIVRARRRVLAWHSVLPGVMFILAGVSLTGLPWYVKNWVQAGNPVYPLAASIFGGRTLTAEKIAQWQQAHRVPPSEADGALVPGLLNSGYRLLQDALRILLTSSFVQPTLVFGLISSCVFIALAWRKLKTTDQKSPWRSEWAWWWLLMGWSLWIVAVWWSATHRIDRFWLPIIGLWAALAAWGILRLRTASPWLVHTLVVLGLVYGALINCSPVIGDNRFFVSLAGLRDDIGDKEHVPRVAPVMAWINQHLTEPSTRVLLIGEARVFEYRVPVIYSTCFDTNPGELLLREHSSDEQRAGLQQAGITHVLVNWTEIQRYRSPGNYGFSSWPQRDDIDRLVSEQVLEPIQWDGGNESTRLYKVR